MTQHRTWERRSARAILAAITLAVAILASRADADDIAIFAGNPVPPNVMIMFDNGGSMGAFAYENYPSQVYAGTYTQGTVYTRCGNKGGVHGGDILADCTCKTQQNNWVADETACATSFVDLIPQPNGDDIDDRESRRKLG